MNILCMTLILLHLLRLFFIVYISLTLNSLIVSTFIVFLKIFASFLVLFFSMMLNWKGNFWTAAFLFLFQLGFCFHLLSAQSSHYLSPSSHQHMAFLFVKHRSDLFLVIISSSREISPNTPQLKHKRAVR